mmetsp:Transcript_16445/g.40478  ORF Transcript_16445/g.40478 Transcript_16445/m.40478 type:complete len:250 (-) Transcript_16445:2823-3572(-)
MVEVGATPPPAWRLLRRASSLPPANSSIVTRTSSEDTTASIATVSISTPAVCSYCSLSSASLTPAAAAAVASSASSAVSTAPAPASPTALLWSCSSRGGVAIGAEIPFMSNIDARLAWRTMPFVCTVLSARINLRWCLNFSASGVSSSPCSATSMSISQGKAPSGLGAEDLPALARRRSGDSIALLRSETMEWRGEPVSMPRAAGDGTRKGGNNGGKKSSPGLHTSSTPGDAAPSLTVNDPASPDEWPI